jgi:hypothetical protein
MPCSQARTRSPRVLDSEAGIRVNRTRC